MRLCSRAETSSVTSSVVWSLRRNVKCRHAERPHSCKLTFGFSLLVKGSEEKNPKQDMTRIRLCYFDHIIGLRVPHNELHLIYNLITTTITGCFCQTKWPKYWLASYVDEESFYLRVYLVGIFLDLVRRSGQQVLHQHTCFQPMPKVLFFYV